MSFPPTIYWSSSLTSSKHVNFPFIMSFSEVRATGIEKAGYMYVGLSQVNKYGNQDPTRWSEGFSDFWRFIGSTKKEKGAYPTKRAERIHKEKVSSYSQIKSYKAGEVFTNKQLSQWMPWTWWRQVEERVTRSGSGEVQNELVFISSYGLFRSTSYKLRLSGSSTLRFYSLTETIGFHTIINEIGERKASRYRNIGQPRHQPYLWGIPPPKELSIWFPVSLPKESLRFLISMN